MSADDDAARRAAELEALEAIYEGGVKAVSDHEWRLQLSDVDALLEVLAHRGIATHRR